MVTPLLCTVTTYGIFLVFLSIFVVTGPAIWASRNCLPLLSFQALFESHSYYDVFTYGIQHHSASRFADSSLSWAPVAGNAASGHLLDLPSAGVNRSEDKRTIFACSAPPVF